MGIKCSLLGHDFGEASVEREREEQGSEVVITIREVESCRSCGETRVVSENKEVTSLATPEEVDAPAEDSAEATDTRDAESAGTDEEAGGDTTVEDDGADGDADPAGGGSSVTAAADPETEDAEILDDGEPDRDPGEWPQEAGEDDEESFDQFDYDDPEADPAVEDEDAELIDAGEDPSGTETTAWPSESEEGVDPDSSGPGAITVPEGEFVCGACGFSTPVAESSLREGDFCPECHDETIVQVTDEQRRNG